MARSQLRSVLWATLMFAAAIVSGAPPDAPTPGNAVLHLFNDGFVTGTLHPCDKRGHLRWQSRLFAAPLEFSLDCVKSVQFPLHPDAPVAKGDYSFELVGGDVLVGSLCSLNEQEGELEVPELGKLRVLRSHIKLIERRTKESDPLYTVPPLATWKIGHSWREELGQVFTDAPGSLDSNFKLPPRASIELEISWKRRADFAIVLGVGADEESAKQAFRLEGWDSTLVILRELKHKADIAHVRALPPTDGVLRLQVLLDQEAGRCLVLSEQGERLADLTVSPEEPRAWPGLRLINRRGDLRLEQLRIDRWSGVPPREVASDKSRVHLTDGSIVQGRIVELDVAAGEFLVQMDTKQQRIAAASIERIWMAHGDGPQSTLSAERCDGLRFCGDLFKVEDDAVWLASAAFSEPLRLPLAGLRSLTPLASDGASFTERVKREAASAGRSAAMLEAAGVRLRGRLIDGREKPPASCLIWQPFGTTAASPLLASASGRIIFEWLPVRRPEYNLLTMEDLRRRRQEQGSVIASGFTPTSMPVLSDRSKRKEGPHSLYLRSGDMIPCEVTGITERGLSIRTALLDETLVAHETIQAIELHEDPPVTITKLKRDRLLTLPRMQRDSPPTHLIRSRDGDYLRGRIVGLDEDRLLVEVRLETKELPRERISRIIWLHDEQRARDVAESPTTAMRVQGVQSDGRRLTLLAEQVSGASLSGKHAVIGPCHIDLDKVGQLLFGSAIEESASKLAYQQWKLQQALEPFAQDEGSAQGAEGTQSNLVGKPAPDFQLQLLEGKKFQLSAQRGKIIVLEFWTTWCGVCLQTMPQIARVAESFADRNVQLVGINLEETPEVVATMLERNKLPLQVALDRDGAVAAKYGVSSLPQVLVIDSGGTVFRHFFGGGPRLGEQLAESLEALIARPPIPN